MLISIRNKKTRLKNPPQKNSKLHRRCFLKVPARTFRLRPVPAGAGDSVPADKAEKKPFLKELLFIF